MKRLIILILDYLNDLKRFRRFSAFGKHLKKNPLFLQGKLMLNAHGVEKGLSLSSFESRRGQAKLRTTLALMNDHRALSLPSKDTAFEMAQDAVDTYRKVHADRGIEIGDLIPDHFAARPLEEIDEGQSLRTAARADLTDAERSALRKGMLTRSSVREYSDAAISEDEIAQIVADSLATPSVCNRQGFRVYASIDPAVIRTALSHQSGNRGFGDKAPGLFIVTCDLSIFQDSSERNQGFVDGGLFSMSLMLSLHAHGFGGCPLNWSASFRQDQALRRAVSIKDREVIIMMISFGKLPETYRAAASRRYPVEHFLCRLSLR